MGFRLDFAPLGLPLGFGRRASGPSVRYLRHQRSRGRDARDCVFGHDLRLGHVIVDVVAGGRDLRLPVVAAFALRAHDRVLSVGPVFHDPFFRGLHGHRKPAGKGMLAHAGLDEPQRLVPELIIVTFPPILTHTKEPHLRSSNLNFLSPTIGARFKEGLWAPS